MHKNYIFTVLLIMTGFISTAQTAPGIQWQKSLGGDSNDAVNSIIQTSDGGYIVAGYSSSNNGDVSGNHGDYDYWIVKLNSSGDIQWQKSLGGSGVDAAQSIKQTFDNGYIVAGSSQSNDGDVSGHHGSFPNSDCWIVKLNSSGGIQWQKSLGGSIDDGASSIVQTSDSGYIVGGFSDSKDGDVTGNHGIVGPRPKQDYWIVKLNSSGDIEWQKSLGGTGFDICTSIVQTSDGGYTAAGFAESNDDDVTENHGGRDYWIVHLNSSGDMLWQKSLGGSNDDVATSIAQTSDNSYIVGGYSLSNDGDVSGNHVSWDCWIVKLNSSGDIQWQKSLGGSNDDAANSIAQTSDSGYIVGGYSRSNDGDVGLNHGFADYWIVKLTSSGDMQWQKDLGGDSSEEASSIIQTSDSGYIVGGSSASNDGDVSGNHGRRDWWIVKLEPAVLSVTLTNFSGEVNGKQNLLHWITVTEQNNTGFEIQRSIDGYNFNKIGFTATKAINGNSNLHLSYDYADNSFAQVTNYYRLKQLDKDGKFSYSNIVVLKGVYSLAPGLSAVYPNPANNILNVKLSLQHNNDITLLITDLTGKSVLSKTTSIGNGESIVQFDISQLSAGTYFLKIVSSDSSENTVMKFAKR